MLDKFRVLCENPPAYHANVKFTTPGTIKGSARKNIPQRSFFYENILWDMYHLD